MFTLMDIKPVSVVILEVHRLRLGMMPSRILQPSFITANRQDSHKLQSSWRQKTERTRHAQSLTQSQDA